MSPFFDRRAGGRASFSRVTPAWFRTGVAETGGARGEAFRPDRASAVFEVLLTEQSRAGDDSRLGVVLVNQIGDVAEQTFNWHPDARLDPGIQLCVLCPEPGLTAAFLSHPLLNDATARPVVLAPRGGSVRSAL